MLRRLALATVATLALIGGATACTGTEPTTPSATGSRATTKTAFNLGWDAYTNAERDTLCQNLADLGPDAATQAITDRADPDSGMDWPYFTTLVTDACNNR